MSGVATTEYQVWLKCMLVSDHSIRYKTGKSNKRTEGFEIKIFKTMKRKQENVSTESRVTVDIK